MFSILAFITHVCIDALCIFDRICLAFQNLKYCFIYTSCKTFTCRFNLKAQHFKVWVIFATVAKDIVHFSCIVELLALFIFGKEGISLNTSLSDLLFSISSENYSFFPRTTITLVLIILVQFHSLASVWLPRSVIWATFTC